MEKPATPAPTKVVRFAGGVEITFYWAPTLQRYVTLVED